MTTKARAGLYEDMGRMRLTNAQFAEHVTAANSPIEHCNESTPFKTTSSIVKANVDTCFLGINYVHDAYPSFGSTGIDLAENELLLIAGVDETGESRNSSAEAVDLLTSWAFDEPARIFDKKKPGITREFPRCLVQVSMCEKQDEDGNYLMDVNGSYVDNYRDISAEHIIKISVNEWLVDTDKDGKRDPKKVEANGQAEFKLQWSLVQKSIPGQEETEYPVLTIYAEITRAPFIGPLTSDQNVDERHKVPYSDKEIKAFYEGEFGVLAGLERYIAFDKTLRVSGSDIADCLRVNARNAHNLHSPNLICNFLREQDVHLHLIEAQNKDQQEQNRIVTATTAPSDDA